MKIAILNMQLDNKHKEWEKRYEVLVNFLIKIKLLILTKENQWKYKLTQQKEYYEKGHTTITSKKVYSTAGTDTL